MLRGTSARSFISLSCHSWIKKRPTLLYVFNTRRQWLAISRGHTVTDAARQNNQVYKISVGLYLSDKTDVFRISAIS